MGFFFFFYIIIKITISSIVIGLKKVSYRTVQEANHIESCSVNQPITFKLQFKIN